MFVSRDGISVVCNIIYFTLKYIIKDNVLVMIIRYFATETVKCRLFPDLLAQSCVGGTGKFLCRHLDRVGEYLQFLCI